MRLVHDTEVSSSLNPADWQRLSEYLDKAFDLDSGERERWLADLATTEPGIADSLRRLLAKQESLTEAGFLESVPRSVLSSVAQEHAGTAGERIGAYTLERLIGRGGMGEVWLASRSDGRFEGHCAIKFVDSLTGRGRFVERFRHEGRLLARLTHPNIARLIDAGSTEDGRQYLAIEYIDGEPIHQYCSSHALRIEERVRLFCDVVSAVATAHANLIIHRDLKPTNVLVTREATAKLLDFGIAKLLSTEHTEGDAALTRIEDVILTPEYAAPEQLLGEVPSTATDVYQLGMLLYVLLTERHPLPFAGSRADRIRAALDGRIPAASELATGPARAQLRGDLDAILSMAMRKEPGERYATAAALREDLLRYLNGDPVSARRGAALYLVRKFVRRHRVAVIASGIAVVSLCGALVFAFSQARVAQDERDRAASLALRNSDVIEFIGTLITEAAASDQPVTVNSMLARSEELARGNSGGSRENRAAILSSIAGLQDSLGNSGKSLELLDQALALVGDSKNRALRAELTCSRGIAIADLGQVDLAARTIDREIGALESDPETAAACLLYRNFIARKAADAEGALRYAQLGLRRFHEAARLHPGSVFEGTREGLLLEAVAFGYSMNGDNSQANHYFELALGKYIQAGRAWGPFAITMRSNWAIVDINAGVPRQALELYDQMVAYMTSNNPGVSLPPYLVHNRARSLELLGRYAEARATYEQGRQLSHDAKNVNAEGICLLGLASVAIRTQEWATAARHIDQSRELLAETAPSQFLTKLMVTQGQLALAEGKFAEARAQFARFLDPKKKTPAMLEGSLAKVEAEVLAGEIPDAVKDARAALGVATSLQGSLPFSSYTGLSWLTLGRALQAQKDRAQASRAFETAALHLSNTVDADHPALLDARRLAMRGP
jgi:tetratricopeptide (TPR) repeat protein